MKWSWSCGHEASECCAECHRLLSVKSTTMVEIIDDLIDDLRRRGLNEKADAIGRKLNEALR